MIRVFLISVLFFSSMAVAAEREDYDPLHEALKSSQLIEILAEEGIQQSEADDADRLVSPSSVTWRQTVRKIYETDRLMQIFRENFDASLDAAELPDLMAFYQSDIGKAIVDVEVEARRAIMSEDVELAAKRAFEDLSETDPERLALLQRFSDANDLIDRNVTGALNSNLSFFRGMSTSSSFDMDETQMLNSVWSREPEIRMDTELWVFGYMTLAYSKISDAQLQAYIDMTEKQHGRALNRALFAGFNAVFNDVSFLLGQATAKFSEGEEL